MRNVDSHILDSKMDEAVNHYIASHQQGEPVQVDSNGLALNVQDESSGRVVTVMHPQSFSSHTLCRQVPGAGPGSGEGQWEGEELLDTEGRIAALVAHLAQHARPPHAHKVQYVRSGDVDTSVILDAPTMRLFNGPSLDQPPESIVVEEVHQLPPLPPLQEMKLRAQEDWFNNKQKAILKEDAAMLTDSDGPVLELGAGASPAHGKQHSKKSLPHKKRISRKLRRNNGTATPHQPEIQPDIVVINCAEEVPSEEILPDNFVAVPHPHMPDAHHIAHEMRPIFICQVCGEFYGEEQLKFYHHLRQHYDPHAGIVLEGPVPVGDIAIDKMTNTCIVDNVATLPDSIVELSLENTVPKTMYQPIDKHILYTSSDKTLNYTSNKMQYSVASMDKEPVNAEGEKGELYSTLDKLELYSCLKCNKSFRKQKHCDKHIKEKHANSKLEDMAEFSEPEDLMEGIHVAVDEGGEGYEQTLLPHLTVDNGHVRQDHASRHWYLRNGGASPEPAAGACATPACPLCPARPSHHETHPHHPHDQHDQHPHETHPHDQHSQQSHVQQPHPHAQHTQQPHPHAQQPPSHLKEEVLQRMLEVEVSPPEPAPLSPFPESIAPDAPAPPPAPSSDKTKKKPPKKFDCNQCGRVFMHRNSLMYHLLSHSDKQHFCRECGKGFYTPQALIIHKRTHSNDRPCKCDVCGREFRQRSDLRYHKVSLHSDRKQFKCDFCNKEFARKYSLSLHRRIHTGERNYKCEYCTKTFRASVYRLAHMRTHTGDRPFKCEECGKCFRVGFDLRRHRATHDKTRRRDPHAPAKLNNIKIENIESITEETHKQFKKDAVETSPNKQELTTLKNVEKKPRAKKSVTKKEGAPNVTVSKTEGQFKIAENNDIEVFELRPEVHYAKFKDIYSSNYKNEDRVSDDRDLMFRSHLEDVDKTGYKGENTDGKLQVYTQREKKDFNAVNALSLGDIRHLEREMARDVRTDSLHGETIENGFLERLTALYNVAE